MGCAIFWGTCFEVENKFWGIIFGEIICYKFWGMIFKKNYLGKCVFDYRLDVENGP